MKLLYKKYQWKILYKKRNFTCMWKYKILETIKANIDKSTGPNNSITQRSNMVIETLEPEFN